MSQDISAFSFEVEREPDGKKYPGWVKESYSMDSAGILEYFAYFGGMPIEMNHTDRTAWKADENDRKMVFDAISRVLNDPALFSELELKEPGNESQTPGKGLVKITVGNTTSRTFHIRAQDKSEAYAVLSDAIFLLIRKFERKTGRPLKPEDLPQSLYRPMPRSVP